MAKTKTGTSKDESASPFGSPRLAEEHVGDDAHGGEIEHGHAGYLFHDDMQRRIDVATGNGAATLSPNPPGT